MAEQNYPMPNMLILPTLNCQATCSYCFGPHMSSPVMPVNTLLDTAKWIRRLAEKATFYPPSQTVKIVFHGGEPLLAGYDFYERALSVFCENVGRPVSFSMLSNLWALDERFAELFKQYQVVVAVSLDGPEAINDQQRGKGYFKRAMAGIKLLRDAGVPVSAICTFTSLSAPKAEEIFDFFLDQRLDFQFKTVVEPFMADHRKIETLPYEEHLRLVEKLLKRFLKEAGKIRVRSLERLIRSIATRENSLYIAGNCLGKQLAVDSEGGIYHCQRFAGIKKFRLSSVNEMLSMEQLMSTDGFCMFSHRMEKVKEECSGCSYFDICAGGCAYNAFTRQTKEDNKSFKDPQCRVYKGILDNIVGLIGTLMLENGQINPEAQAQKKVLQLLLGGKPKIKRAHDDLNSG